MAKRVLFHKCETKRRGRKLHVRRTGRVVDIPDYADDIYEDCPRLEDLPQQGGGLAFAILCGAAYGLYHLFTWLF